MAKKTLSVPQNGTQPAMNSTPIDNMLAGTTNTVSKKESEKKPTSFNLDKNIFLNFKADCARQGRVMSEVVEELMQEFCNKGQQ